MLVNRTRPTEEMVERAWDANKDGAGIAWREGAGDRTEVVWRKGVMDVKDIKPLVASVPLPFVVHFRVASCGGVNPKLTHPFLVSEKAPLLLEGRTKGAVLFHNGHWNGWNDKALDAAIHSNTKLPEGNEWSDTRAMAWMVHIYGPELIDLLATQKGVLMSPHKFNIFTGNGWEKINEVWCSNDYFWKGRRHVTTYGRTCRMGKCTRTAMSGKDLCYQCEQEQKAAAQITVTDAPKETTQKSAVEIVTGGVSRPLAQTFTVAEVEAMQKAGKASKSELKKFRRYWSDVNERGNRGVRAKANLVKLSERIAAKLQTGYIGSAH
jgi:hypothetical protein